MRLGWYCLRSGRDWKDADVTPFVLHKRSFLIPYFLALWVWFYKERIPKWRPGYGIACDPFRWNTPLPLVSYFRAPRRRYRI